MYCALIFQFKLTLAHDGSGKGAALVAAVAQRTRYQRDNSVTNDNTNTTNNNIESDKITDSINMIKVDSGSRLMDMSS